MIAENDVVKIQPTPHFVVKTRILQPSRVVNVAPGTKVFVNVCSADEVPAPPTPFEPSMTFELIMSDKWEIPIVTSSQRTDADKRGVGCVVFDCVINTAAMKWCQEHRQLREIVMEWCLESVEVTGECVLDREKISVPKMSSKGTPSVVEWVKEENIGGTDDVGGLLEMKRLIEDAEVVEIDLPGNRQLNKPLIQEINDLSLETQHNETPKPVISSEKLKYTTTIKKVDINSFKLEIDIISQNTSSLDYDLSLDRTTNTLLLKNTNPKYTAKDLELPLPTIFSEPEIKTFFVASEKKLVVFVK